MPQLPGRSMALDRGADLARDDESHLRSAGILVRGIRREDVHDHRPPADPTTPAYDQVEVCTAAQPRLPGQHGNGSGRQLVATAATTARDDRAASAGTHAQPEAMGAGAATVVRLIGALAHGAISPTDSRPPCEAVSCGHPGAGAIRARNPSHGTGSTIDPSSEATALCGFCARVPLRPAPCGKLSGTVSVRRRRIGNAGRPPSHPLPRSWRLHNVRDTHTGPGVRRGTHTGMHRLWIAVWTVRPAAVAPWYGRSKFVRRSPRRCPADVRSWPLIRSEIWCHRSQPDRVDCS